MNIYKNLKIKLWSRIEFQTGSFPSLSTDGFSSSFILQYAPLQISVAEGRGDFCIFSELVQLIFSFQ